MELKTSHVLSAAHLIRSPFKTKISFSQLWYEEAWETCVISRHSVCVRGLFTCFFYFLEARDTWNHDSDNAQKVSRMNLTVETVFLIFPTWVLGFFFVISNSSNTQLSSRSFKITLQKKKLQAGLPDSVPDIKRKTQQLLEMPITMAGKNGEDYAWILRSNWTGTLLDFNYLLHPKFDCTGLIYRCLFFLPV